VFKDLLDLDHPLFWTVEGILSPDECAELIDRIEAADRAGEAELATINAAGGPTLRPEVRNNTRVIFDDPALAARLYERVRDQVPETLMGWVACGANERLRCYRYQPGEKFAAHYDGSFQRSDSERSLLTFMIYLNEGFAGGETTFLELGEAIAPKPGLALLFQHPILHEGSEVTDGTKYAIRSDIMYRAP
jgi:predicted 2-oxoglutarate/Fe(II)-dependent dioxygenase YbiX